MRSTVLFMLMTSMAILSPILVPLYIIQLQVNKHRAKLREKNYDQRRWLLALGLKETAGLIVEDIKKPIRWFDNRNKINWNVE